MARQNLTEASANTRILEAHDDGSLLIQLITPGWGSSGYYSAEVLETACSDKVWPAGTHMYFNHPSASEAVDRPERDVRDLAATLLEDSRWDSAAERAVARVMPVGLGKTVLADEAFRKAIACSVRASAEMKVGEADGRKGWIVEKIHPDTFNSVDFVTHAGRGGMILESARRAEAFEATASDTERAIQDAVAAMYADRENDVYAWMRDYDPDKGLAYFEIDSDGKCTTYAQPYTVADNGDVALTGDRVEVDQRTEYVPTATAETAAPNVPAPAGQSTTTQESQEDTMPEIEEGAKVSIKESRLTELEEAAGRVPVLEAKLASETERANSAEQDLAVEKARGYARDFGLKRVREANSELAAPVVEKIVAEAMREIPLTEAENAADRRLDTDAFGKRVDEAQKAEETYLASISQPGHVRGVGSTTQQPEITEAQLSARIAGAFGTTVKGA